MSQILIESLYLWIIMLCGLASFMCTVITNKEKHPQWSLLYLCFVDTIVLKVMISVCIFFPFTYHYHNLQTLEINTLIGILCLNILTSSLLVYYTVRNKLETAQKSFNINSKLSSKIF